MVQTSSDDSTAYRTNEYGWDTAPRKEEAILTTQREEKASVREASAWRAHLYRDHVPLKSTWQALERTGCCTPFQTYDWASAWYETLAAVFSVEPLIVTVSRHHDPEIIFPLCLHRKGNLKIVSFPDLGVSDYSGPVFSSGVIQNSQEAKSVMKAVLNVLPTCDLVHFYQFQEKIDGEPNPLFLLGEVERLPDENCFGVCLREDWENQAEEIMDRPLLSTIRRRRTQLIKQHGAVIYDRVSDPAELNQAWESLVIMRRERFLKLKRDDILTDPTMQSFYRFLLTHSNRVLDVSITRMTVAGETIASCFGVTREGTYYMLMPTFQMGKWDRFMPGMQLFYEMMKTQAASGAGYFDFTIGDEGYKSRFGAQQNALYEWRKPMSAKGALSHGMWLGKTILRKYPKLHSLIKSLKTALFR